MKGGLGGRKVLCAPYPACAGDCPSVPSELQPFIQAHSNSPGGTDLFHTFNPRLSLRVCGQLGLHREFQGSQGDVTLARNATLARKKNKDKIKKIFLFTEVGLIDPELL